MSPKNLIGFTPGETSNPFTVKFLFSSNFLYFKVCRNEILQAQTINTLLILNVETVLGSFDSHCFSMVLVEKSDSVASNSFSQVGGYDQRNRHLYFLGKRYKCY